MASLRRSGTRPKRPAARHAVEVSLTIAFDREVDGRWIADVPELPGVLVYGRTKREAIAKVKALAYEVLASDFRRGRRVQFHSRAA